MKLSDRCKLEGVEVPSIDEIKRIMDDWDADFIDKIDAIRQMKSLIVNLQVPEPREELDEEKIGEILYDMDHPNSTLRWKDLRYDLREKYIWRARAICQKFGKVKGE